MLYTLFLIFCIIAGFNGMPYLFFFPILTIVGVIVIWIGTWKILESEDNSKTFNIPHDRQGLADYLCVERSAMSAEITKLQK